MQEAAVIALAKRMLRTVRLLRLATLGASFAIALAGAQGSAQAAACPSMPYTLTNGQLADATQVMANFNALLTCLNTGQFIDAPSATRQFTGPGGGIITMQNPSATANYNFNLPATAGNAGELLTSAGGGTAPDTWTVIGGDLALSAGALNLGATSVVPGSYTLSAITVDSKGRITAASNGPGTGTAGHMLPYLDGSNTWSGTQTFGPVVGSVSTRSGTTYTLAASDCGTTVVFTSAAPITVTTLNSLPPGCSIALEQSGTGQITIAAGSGATQHSAHSFTKSYGQYAILGLFVDGNVGGAAANFIITGDGA